MKVKDVKGGSGIFPYWITVLVVSAPFVYFLSQNAALFNLKKQEVLITTSLLCFLSLLYPFAIQNEKILPWGLSCVGGLSLPWLMRGFRTRKLIDAEPVWLGTTVKSEEIAEMEEVTKIEEVTETEEVTKIEEVTETEEVTEIEEVTETGEVTEIEEVTEMEEAAEIEKMNLEELIEKGFQAKEDGRFLYAAEWFIHAIDRRPSHDLVFYLIVDSYWLLKRGDTSGQALSKIKPIVNEYLEKAPPEWRKQLLDWLVKEEDYYY